MATIKVFNLFSCSIIINFLNVLSSSTFFLLLSFFFFVCFWILSTAFQHSCSCSACFAPVWYDCYSCLAVCVCVSISVWDFFFFSSLPPHCSLAAPDSQCCCFSLTWLLFEMQKKCDSFFVCFLLFNLLSIQYLNLILLSGFFFVRELMAEYCGNAWLLTVTFVGMYECVCVREWFCFCLWVCVCVGESCCLDIQEKFKNDFSWNKRRKKGLILIIVSFPFLTGRQIIMEMF